MIVFFVLRLVFHNSDAYNYWDLNIDVIMEIIGQLLYLSMFLLAYINCIY